MNPNPYASPGGAVSPPADFVDRARRSSLAVAVRRFLDGEMGSFEFDEMLGDYWDSQDSAVRFVTHALWCCYDDNDDHLAALDKPAWGYLQRLLLLLESDNAIEQTTIRHWSWTQAVAMAAVVGFIVFATRVDYGWQLIPVTIPLGMISIAISFARRRAVTIGPYDPILYPFTTFADLKKVYESVATFKKKKYPPQMATRQIRSPLLTGFFHIQSYATWLIFSPLVLFFQMFPKSETHSRVVTD
jgi:hypothetical protein